MNNRSAIITIILLSVHAFFTHLFTEHFSQAPLKETINLSQPVNSMFDVDIPMEQTYQIKLLFDREEQDFEYLKGVLGNMTNSDENGIPLDVAWSLHKEDTLVKSTSLVALNSCGWSQAQVYRCLGKIKVPPGKYRFSISINHPNIEFAKFRSYISINYNFKSGDTWHTGYMFWGMLFNLFIAPFVGGTILLALIIRYIRHLTSGSTGSCAASLPLAER
ncbi:DUF5625 family protein [Neptunomonas antarctica]|uniref:DUF5625 domain-containing protein n=1 Tax=Neptunomonas antarctica TaxID=619304 RepID=A0A1N7LZ28_9GAMM|nr:DUF5625 family protein [Neptunomonas antarctica]SIS79019.1 hypothetical protein SAMN05421760_1055 [Neptunomonas antarctica]